MLLYCKFQSALSSRLFPPVLKEAGKGNLNRGKKAESDCSVTPALGAPANFCNVRLFGCFDFVGAIVCFAEAIERNASSYCQ